MPDERASSTYAAYQASASTSEKLSGALGLPQAQKPSAMIDVGVRADHFWRERERCYESVLSPDCRKQCSACGAAGLLKGGKCDG